MALKNVDEEPMSDLEKKIGRRFPIVMSLVVLLAGFGILAFILPLITANPSATESISFLREIAVGVLGFLAGIMTAYFGAISIEKGKE